MTVGPACDARAKRAAARAERLQTSSNDETLADIAQGGDSGADESSEDGASDDDDSVDGGATPGGGGSEWKSRGRRKRDLSAQGKFKCQHLPDVVIEQGRSPLGADGLHRDENGTTGRFEADEGDDFRR